MLTHDTPRWRITVHWVDEALARIQSSANHALQARQTFHLVLAGGNTPREVYQRMHELDTDWLRWHIWYGDERCLPRDHISRNSRLAGEAWLDRSLIPLSQRYEIPAEMGAAQGAIEYSQTLANMGDFDLVLLGLGEDGHTASLFPGQLQISDDVIQNVSPAVAVLNAPKPPPERVSMSVARLSQTREALFLVTGQGKRQAVMDWQAGVAIPASLIRPASGIDVLLSPDVLA